MSWPPSNGGRLKKDYEKKKDQYFSLLVGYPRYYSIHTLSYQLDMNYVIYIIYTFNLVLQKNTFVVSFVLGQGADSI